MCNVAVSDIPWHRYKRNWPITCHLSGSGSVLHGAFLFWVYINTFQEIDNVKFTDTENISNFVCHSSTEL